MSKINIKPGETILEFADEGQDFFSFKLDDEGYIIDVVPLIPNTKSEVDRYWHGTKIMKPAEISCSDHIYFRYRDETTSQCLHYSLTRIIRESADGLSFSIEVVSNRKEELING